MIAEATIAQSSKPRAAAYIRVSTQRQARDGLSLEEQTHAFYEACKKYDYEPVHLFNDEAHTSKVPLLERPAGKQLQQAILNGDIDVVVIRNISRAFRNTGEAAITADRWYKVDKVQLRILDMPFDFGDKYGRFFFHIMAAVAELQREMIVDRTREALAIARAKGITSQFSPPVGNVYRHKNTTKLEIVRCPETWKQMEWLHELYYEKGWTLSRIREFCYLRRISRVITTKRTGVKLEDGRKTVRIVKRKQIWGSTGIKLAIDLVQRELEQKKKEQEKA